MKEEIGSLKIAAKELVDLVVKDEQPPDSRYFSKAALIPYSAAVNVGGYADLVRGQLEEGIYEDKGDQAPDYDQQKRGWTHFKFKNDDGGYTRTFEATKCVTERTNSARYSDVAPSTPRPFRINNGVGRHYENKNKPASERNGCLKSEIMPLTSNKQTLRARIDTFQAEGSTAGHIGLAWGWYMLSPSWGSIWTGESKPRPYKEERLIKVLVLMTDGEFNTVYADGVISKSSTSGSGDREDKINETAPNGSAFTQAQALCAAMKAKDKDIVIYTVGFALVDREATTLMNTCATDADHVYLPNSGVALKDAFRSIGQDINKLRISK